MGNFDKYKRQWEYFEKVEILSVTPIAGWGVCIGEVKKLFKFYFCEIESWCNKGDTYTLDAWLDFTAEAPIYFFSTWDAAKTFAETTSNRYPLERRLWWLRFQPQYWFITIFNAQLEIISYLSDKERIMYLQSLTQSEYMGV